MLERELTLSKKVLAKPVMQSQPQITSVSNTQIADNKIFKRSVKFLRRDQKTKGSHEPPVQQVYEPEIKTAHKPADESFDDPCHVTPVAPTRCQVPSPAIYRGPCHNNRPVSSQPVLIPGDLMKILSLPLDSPPMLILLCHHYSLICYLTKLFYTGIFPNRLRQIA